MRRFVVPFIAVLTAISCTDIPTEIDSPQFKKTAGNKIHVQPPTGDPVQDHKNLKEALNAAQEGDVVELAAGRYQLEITLYICDRDVPECGLDASEAPTANNITVKGHEDGTVIDGLEEAFDGLAGWMISGLTLREMTFQGFTRAAIAGFSVEDFTVTECEFLSDNHVAVWVATQAEGVTIHENVIEGSWAGIWVQQVSDGPITIRENQISGVWSTQAIRVVNSSGEVRIEENILIDNYRGIRNANNLDEVFIVENIIADSWLVGVRLDGGSTTLKENQITDTDGPGLCVAGGTFTLDEDVITGNNPDVVIDPEDGCP